MSLRHTASILAGSPVPPLIRQLSATVDTSAAPPTVRRACPVVEGVVIDPTAPPHGTEQMTGQRVGGAPRIDAVAQQLHLVSSLRTERRRVVADDRVTDPAARPALVHEDPVAGIFPRCGGLAGERLAQPVDGGRLAHGQGTHCLVDLAGNPPRVHTGCYPIGRRHSWPNRRRSRMWSDASSLWSRWGTDRRFEEWSLRGRSARRSHRQPLPSSASPHCQLPSQPRASTSGDVPATDSEEGFAKTSGALGEERPQRLLEDLGAQPPSGAIASTSAMCGVVRIAAPPRLFAERQPHDARGSMRKPQVGDGHRRR